ncbi:Uncharacterised protein at_DN1292 [Pycnogonum litorale]
MVGGLYCGITPLLPSFTMLLISLEANSATRERIINLQTSSASYILPGICHSLYNCLFLLPVRFRDSDTPLWRRTHLVQPPLIFTSPVRLCSPPQQSTTIPEFTTDALEGTQRDWPQEKFGSGFFFSWNYEFDKMTAIEF